MNESSILDVLSGREEFKMSFSFDTTSLILLFLVIVGSGLIIKKL